MYKKTKTRLLSALLTAAVTISCIGFTDTAKLHAAGKAALKTKKVTLTVGAKKTIKITAKKKNAKYSFKASNKKIKVTKKGVVTGKKAGTAKVTVKETYKKKTRKLGVVTVTVKKKSKPELTEKPVITDSPVKTETPAVDTPTASPDITKKPEATATTTPSKEPAKPQIFYANHFDDGELQGISVRGSSLDISKDENHTDGGQQCLAVTDRTAGWHGAQMELSEMVKVGETYRICSWVKQKSGSKENISMTISYKADGTDHYDGVAGQGAEVENDTWTKLEGNYTIPANEGSLTLYWESTSSETLDFYIDDVELEGVPSGTVSSKYTPDNETYAEMKENSVLSTGNNARIKQVIEKARAGEDVTLAYIGGSITEGALASPNSKCYAEASANAFASTYGKDGGSNVHFVNAGMSGTPSSLGIIRYDRDVLGQMTAGSRPDILFIEFAVNDYGECTAGGAYDGMIRRALKSGSAVVLIFSIFQSGRVLETTYKPYGKYYDLPMISMGDAIEKHFKTDGFKKWFFGDTLHPNNTGHKLMSDCIMTLFDKIDKEEAEADNIDSSKLPEPHNKAADSYTNIQMIDPNTDITKINAISSLNAGSFKEKDGNTGAFQYEYKGQKGQAWFPDNWMHKAASGTDSFTAKVKCKTLMVIYKLSSSTTTGSIDLYVDGEKKQTLSGYDKGGWNNATPAVIFCDSEAKEHNIEIKMADGDEAKEFTLIGLGYSE